jgi:hypothetical protein
LPPAPPQPAKKAASKTRNVALTEFMTDKSSFFFYRGDAFAVNGTDVTRTYEAVRAVRREETGMSFC